MINWLLKKLIGTKNEREVKRLRKFVEKINQKEKELDELSNRELVSLSRELFYKVSQNEELKDQITKGKDNRRGDPCLCLGEGGGKEDPRAKVL